VGADIVVGPESPERLAAGGELADEVLETAVVRIASGLGSHDADAHLGEQVPIRVEVARGGVEELEPGQVRRTTTVAEDGRVERPAEGVGGEEVLARVPDERDAVRDGLQRPLQARPGGGLGRGAAPGAARGRDAVGGAGEVEEVGAFGVVELQRPGERLQDAG
jgi:hypothetical protein